MAHDWSRAVFLGKVESHLDLKQSDQLGQIGALQSKSLRCLRLITLRMFEGILNRPLLELFDCFVKSLASERFAT